MKDEATELYKIVKDLETERNEAEKFYLETTRRITKQLTVHKNRLKTLQNKNIRENLYHLSWISTPEAYHLKAPISEEMCAEYFNANLGHYFGRKITSDIYLQYHRYDKYIELYVHSSSKKDPKELLMKFCKKYAIKV